MSTIEEPERTELASLAAEVAELLRFEHEAGAIGVLAIEAPRVSRSPATLATSGPTASGPTAMGPSAAQAPVIPPLEIGAPPARSGFERPRAQPPAPTASEATGPDLDALLARARKARAPSPPPEPTPQVAASASVATSAPETAPASSASVRSPIVRSADPARLTVLGPLAREAAQCKACRLHESRTKSVFARGSAEAELVFVGEGPGFNEDKQGEPFVGAAGQLLDKMIGAMGLGRDGVYICNVVKCRPPENRTPLPDESAACAGFLDGQLTAIGPRVIVALGRCAAERLGCVEVGRSWRGSWGEYRGVPVMPTYHPAYLLRNAEMKRPVWEDLQKVTARLRGGAA